MQCPNCFKDFDTWRGLTSHWRQGCPVTLLERFSRGTTTAELAREYRLPVQKVWDRIKLGAVIKGQKLEVGNVGRREKSGSVR